MNNIILLNPSASENGSTASSDRRASEISREPTAKDLIRAANAAFHEGRLPEAREALRAALACQPDDSELILALGHVEFGLAQFDLALRRYHLAAEMNPLRAEAHSSQALTLKLLGHRREADAAARRALGIDANDIVALKVLAKIRLEEGHHHQALQLCRRVLDQNPSDAEGLDFLDQCRFELDEQTADGPGSKPDSSPEFNIAFCSASPTSAPTAASPRAF